MTWVVNNPDWPSGHGPYYEWEDQETLTRVVRLDERGNEMNRYEIALRLTGAANMSLQEWVELGEKLREYGAPVYVPTVADAAKGAPVDFAYEVEAADLWDARGLVDEVVSEINSFFAMGQDLVSIVGKPLEKSADNHSRKVRVK